MKNLLLAGAVAVAAVSALGQGTVNFNNSPATVGGSGAPVFLGDVGTGVKLEGAAYAVQLYAGVDVNSLAPIGAALGFRTGAGAGFINTAGVDTVRSIATVAPGATATVVLKAWDTEGGKYSSFDAASSALKAVGQSAPLSVVTGGAGSPPGLPANLVGLQSFGITVIPEPSMLALGVLGIAGLLLRRRS
jgi:hypothetical protein